MLYPYEFFTARNDISDDELSGFLGDFHFTPNGFGHQKDSPAAICSDRLIGDFDFIYLIGNTTRVFVGDREYDCVPGDFIYIPPFVKHSILTPACAPHDNYWLHLDIAPDYLQAAFIGALFPEGEHRLHVGVNESLLSLYRMLEREWTAGREGVMVVYRALVMMILTEVFRSSPRRFYREGPAFTESERGIVQACSEYLKSHLHMNLSVKDLAQAASVSESYLYRVFARVMSLSPAQYMTVFRVKAAERLLKTSNLPVKEISARLAFQSPFYFSQVFKRYYGLPPSIYREEFFSGWGADGRREAAT